MNVKLLNTEMFPKVGEQIGDCTIEHILSEGQKNLVYIAHNTRFDTKRIIKVLKPDPFSPMDSDRFFNEARILANIHHPNIVHCYNMFMYRKNTPLMEVEFVEGKNLNDWLKAIPRIPVVVALSIASSICKALIETHTCVYTLYDKQRIGVIHRNIKPSNIVIDTQGVVKLTDFGVAKADSVDLQTKVTKAVGDYSYLSPEQIKNEKVDQTTDIYSLGCVLYEMIAGRRAYAQNNHYDLLISKYREEYDRMPLIDVDDDITDIMYRCLRRPQVERFESAFELSNEIDSILIQYGISNPAFAIKEFIDKYYEKKYIEPERKKEKRRNWYLIASIAANIALISGITIFSIVKHFL